MIVGSDRLMNSGFGPQVFGAMCALNGFVLMAGFRAPYQIFMSGLVIFGLRLNNDSRAKLS